MKVYQTRAEPALGGSYRVVTMRTTRGDVMCRYYRAPNARRAAIWVVGVGGGFVSPAGDFYPRLCTELLGHGIASLQVSYRDPVNLRESVFDVLAGIGYLCEKGIERLARIHPAARGLHLAHHGPDGLARRVGVDVVPVCASLAVALDAPSQEVEAIVDVSDQGLARRQP